MKRVIFAVGIVALWAGPGLGGGPSGAERDPEEVFRKACERLATLEAKHPLLQGVAKVKPALEHDDQKRLKSARLIFASNAVPPGKNPAIAKDASQPFVYVSVETWAGLSQQPAPDMQTFKWKGQDYQLWVRVFASDSALVKLVRSTVDEPLSGPAALPGTK